MKCWKYQGEFEFSYKLSVNSPQAVRNGEDL